MQGELSTTSSDQHGRVNPCCLPAGTPTLAAHPFISVQCPLLKHAVLRSHTSLVHRWFHLVTPSLLTPVQTQPSSPALVVMGAVALLHCDCCCFFLRGGFLPGTCGGEERGHGLVPCCLWGPVEGLARLCMDPLEPAGSKRRMVSSPSPAFFLLCDPPSVFCPLTAFPFHLPSEPSLPPYRPLSPLVPSALSPPSRFPFLSLQRGLQGSHSAVAGLGLPAWPGPSATAVRTTQCSAAQLSLPVPLSM